MRLLSLFGTLLVAVGCAHPAAAPPAANASSSNDESDIRPGESTEVIPVGETPAPSSPPQQQAAEGSTEIPKVCAPPGGGELCIPDASFVKRLCNASYPDTALVLFAKDSVFTRAYMKGDVDGWNADGGASTRAHLVFDEEVLVLKRRAAPANSIVVGASGGFLVMRWDGSCYTLDEGEVTTKKPPGAAATKHGPIPWRAYSEQTKKALLDNPRILTAFQRRGKECKGVVTGTVSIACEKADTALSESVVTEVRAGMAIPNPAHRP